MQIWELEEARVGLSCSLQPPRTPERPGLSLPATYSTQKDRFRDKPGWLQVYEGALWSFLCRWEDTVTAFLGCVRRAKRCLPPEIWSLLFFPLRTSLWELCFHIKHLISNGKVSNTKWRNWNNLEADEPS